MADSRTALNILIVDDSFEDREILKRYLKGVNDYDCTVTEAKNVDEGILAIQKDIPDLMFVDFNMPGASGLDLLDKLRKFNQFQFPIIMLTGEGNEAVAVSAMKMGVGDYLVKDEINPDLVRLAILSTLDRFKMEKTIEAQRRELEIAARTDGLTGLWNRKYFDEQLALEVERAQRYGLVLTLVMADLDRFKDVNDTHGHLIGDAVLVGFSEVLKKDLRLSDFAARFGGEEFCMIIPSNSGKDTALCFKRVAEDFKATKFFGNGAKPFFVSASFGIVQHCSKFDSTEKLIHAADRALYHAKQNGRDKVVLIDEDGKFQEV
jgi:diguanylate cyclase (GGDEF)-like protein